jgi:hypothetical protein
LDIPVKTRQGNFFENVSDITGVAIPLYYEIMLHQKFGSLNQIKQLCGGNSEIQEMIANIINSKTITIQETLILSNIWVMVMNGYVYKMNQII